MADAPSGNGLESRIARIDERTQNTEDLLRALRTDVAKITDDHEARIRAVEHQTQELGTRLNLWQGVQGTFTAVVGAVAAFLGTRQ